MSRLGYCCGLWCLAFGLAAADGQETPPETLRVGFASSVFAESSEADVPARQGGNGA